MEVTALEGAPTTRRGTLAWCALIVGLTTSPVGAAAQEAASASGGMTTVFQGSSDARARPEAVASVDLFATLTFSRFRLESYLEANTTPRRDGVSRLIGEANTDAGTALNRRRRGRVQLSELRIAIPIGGAEVHGGLLDATGFLDVSRIANDENLFFLGVPFVNNPTINFPDYALGLAAAGRVPGTRQLEFGAVVTSSNGLADNPNVSYAQLLRVRDQGKGVFAGAALRWEGEDRRASIGAWVNTAAKERLDGSGTESGAGAFGVLGWFAGPHSLSARAGVADQRVSAVRAFLGLTYLHTGPLDVGIALGRSEASTWTVSAADVSHGELFVRRHLLQGLYITASLQRVRNPGLDATGLGVGPLVWIPSLRVAAQF